MIKRDIEATIAQHFEDKRSYVAPDGREVLYGKDWNARKYALCCHLHFRCEQVTGKIPERCKEVIWDVHHRIKRSVKRDDRISNLEGLCRKHHNMRHPEKQPQWTRGKRSVGHSLKR